MARRILALALLVLGAGVIAAGLGLFSDTPELSLESTKTGPAADTAAPTIESTPTTAPATDQRVIDQAVQDAAATLPRGVAPHRVSIPAIGVDAPIVELGYKSSDEIEVPSSAHEAGWFTPSRRPGEIGPAIIAGHVDLNGGRAVFHDLRSLEPGDEIVVQGAGGTLTFVVDELGQYPKDSLPDEVFGFGQGRPELRLITCGGVFNRATGHYEDNIVVYAHQEDW